MIIPLLTCCQPANKKKPTGSAAIPEDVVWAKEINKMINEKVEVWDVDDDDELTILNARGTTDHNGAVLISSDGEQEGKG